jgi:hypothetical protein
LSQTRSKPNPNSAKSAKPGQRQTKKTPRFSLHFVGDILVDGTRPNRLTGHGLSPRDEFEAKCGRVRDHHDAATPASSAIFVADSRLGI